MTTTKKPSKSTLTEGQKKIITRRVGKAINIIRNAISDLDEQVEELKAIRSVLSQESDVEDDSSPTAQLWDQIDHAIDAVHEAEMCAGEVDEDTAL